MFNTLQDDPKEARHSCFYEHYIFVYSIFEANTEFIQINRLVNENIVIKTEVNKQKSQL